MKKKSFLNPLNLDRKKTKTVVIRTNKAIFFRLFPLYANGVISELTSVWQADKF